MTEYVVHQEAGSPSRGTTPMCRTAQKEAEALPGRAGALCSALESGTAEFPHLSNNTEKAPPLVDKARRKQGFSYYLIPQEAAVCLEAGRKGWRPRGRQRCVFPYVQ